MSAVKLYTNEFKFFGFSYFYGYGFLSMKKINSDLRS